MSEARIQRDILLAIGALPGVLVLRNSVGHAIHTDEKGITRRVGYGLGVGSPDLVCIVAPHGRVLGLEIKVPGEKPTALQVECHRQWRAFGAVVVVVTSAAEALAAVKEMQS